MNDHPGPLGIITENRFAFPPEPHLFVLKGHISDKNVQVFHEQAHAGTNDRVAHFLFVHSLSFQTT
jgi:hypothetical protein